MTVTPNPKNLATTLVTAKENSSIGLLQSEVELNKFVFELAGLLAQQHNYVLFPELWDKPNTTPGQLAVMLPSDWDIATQPAERSDRPSDIVRAATHKSFNGKISNITITRIADFPAQSNDEDMIPVQTLIAFRLEGQAKLGGHAPQPFAVECALHLQKSKFDDDYNIYAYCRPVGEQPISTLIEESRGNARKLKRQKARMLPLPGSFGSRQ